MQDTFTPIPHIHACILSPGAIPVPRRIRLHRQLGGWSEAWAGRVLGHGQGLPAWLMEQGNPGWRGHLRPAGPAAGRDLCAGHAGWPRDVHSCLAQVCEGCSVQRQRLPWHGHRRAFLDLLETVSLCPCLSSIPAMDVLPCRTLDMDKFAAAHISDCGPTLKMNAEYQIPPGSGADPQVRRHLGSQSFALTWVHPTRMWSMPGSATQPGTQGHACSIQRQSCGRYPSTISCQVP